MLCRCVFMKVRELYVEFQGHVLSGGWRISALYESRLDCLVHVAFLRGTKVLRISNDSRKFDLLFEDGLPKAFGIFAIQKQKKNIVKGSVNFQKPTLITSEKKCLFERKDPRKKCATVH